MGVISSMLNSLDQSAEVANEQKDLINALEGQAQAVADKYVLAINERLLGAGDGTDQTIAIKAVIQSDTTTRCTSAVGPNNSIAEHVTDAVGGFVTGGSSNIMNGIANLLNTALGAILGEGGGSTGTFQKYYVAMNDAALLRLDVWGWSYTLEASALKSTEQYSMASAYYLSSVDIDKLDFGTFVDLYQIQLGSVTPPMTPEQVEDEITQLQGLYKALKDQETSELKPLGRAKPVEIPTSRSVKEA